MFGIIDTLDAHHGKPRQCVVMMANEGDVMSGSSPSHRGKGKGSVVKVEVLVLLPEMSRATREEGEKLATVTRGEMEEGTGFRFYRAWSWGV